MQTRIATSDDAPALLALINRAFVVEKFFVDRDRTTPEELAEYLRRGTFLLFDRDDGSLAASLYFESRGDRAYVGMLSVNPDLQGQGIGRQMMTAAEDHARALGCRGIDINVVNLREELPPFYRSLGYVEHGCTDPADDPGATRPYHFILMAKELTTQT
ncbi:MAG TPA: GNAT family N-acetyltransferase [Vicinamibacterales bacterium]|nr:GNAT family N-acetyltransferase [Vicinamibacterales bacterium]